jgi:hypothetical protein
MGFHLFYEVTYNAPQDWDQSMMHVAQVIAMDADEQTRRSRIRQEDLLSRTRMKSWSGIKQVFQRLDESGYPFRIALGKDKDGRVFYAARGHATDYYVPHMNTKRFTGAPFTVNSLKKERVKAHSPLSP